MPERKSYNIGQKALLRRIEKLKISKEEKVEVFKIAEFIFKLIDEK